VIPNDDIQLAHQILPEIGTEGVQRIQSAHIGVIGVGGLGCPVVWYLAAAGVQRITLCDFDRISQSNLSRQILFSQTDVGQHKVLVAAEKLNKNYPNTQTQTIKARMNESNIAELAKSCDLIIDASDNFSTRLAVNTACLRQQTPWVMGAAIRFEGQICTFNPSNKSQPCYECIYADAALTMDDCAGAGVFGPMTGSIGAMMAMQALLLLNNQAASGLHLFDGKRMQWQTLKSKRRADCPACHD